MDIKIIKSINNNLDSINIKESLIELLIDAVSNEASIGFVKPLSNSDALNYWESVEGDLKDECKLVLVAIMDNKLVGTISLSWSKMLTNSSHRAEVQKLLVSSQYRGRGIAKQLLKRIEELALLNSFKLLILDTKAIDPISPNLYRSNGYIEVGTIPYFAHDTTGYHSTLYFYKIINKDLLLNKND